MSIENESVETTAVESAPEVATPEVSTESTASPPQSMEDTIRAKLREMNAPEEITQEEAPAQTGQPRGPDGKFVKTETTAEAPVEEPVAEEPEEAPAQPVQAPKPGAVDLTKPPTSLKGNVQAKWAKLDEDVRAEFHRREANFHEGLSAYKQMADIGKIMDAEVRPYEAMLRAAGLSAPVAVRDLLNTAYQLRTGTPEVKTEIMLNIAKQYGIDLVNIQEAAQQLASAEPKIDPAIQPLQQKLTAIEQMIEQQKKEAADRQYAELQRETQTFASNPKNRFYEMVKLDMAALIETGRADGLQDAYDKAIWANPEARAQLLAEQQAAERKQKAEKAAAAKKAAVTNVAPRGTLPVTPKPSSMDDAIRSKYRELMANA